MKCYIENIKNEKGFVLPIVLIMLVVLGIILISLAALAASNARQTVAQEHNLKAHYLARSGIEIAYGALMTTEEGAKDRLFDTFEDNESYTLNETIEINDQSDNLVGSVEINIYRSDDWVTIHALGNLSDGQGQSELFLDIDIDEPEHIIWRNN